MAKWENFVGFGTTQQNNYFSYWQREKLEFQPGLGCHLDNCCEQPHSSYQISYYCCGHTEDRNGPSLPSVCETPEPLAGPWIMPEETTAPDEMQDEDPVEDPNLHLNIEELNQVFMAKSEEVYNSLMSCHWQPLDTVLSDIPVETSKVKQGVH